MGVTWDGVIDIIGLQDLSAKACIRPKGTDAMIQEWQLGLGRFTVYGMTVVSVSPCLVLSLSQSSTCFSHAPMGNELTSNLLEIGAGFGGMGIGAAYMGAKPYLSVDHCQLCVEHLQANTHGKVLLQDINDTEAPLNIHRLCHGVPLLATFGFPCQPYSRQGQCRGFQDTRALTLPSGLRLMWALQVQGAILECVPMARNTPEVREALHCLALAMGWDILELTFDLCQQWASSRSRWWIIMLPRRWNSVGLHPWPVDRDHYTIGSVFRGWGTWDESSEQSLQLTPTELALYSDEAFGSDKRMMTLQDHAACILHSYSNATTSCPCGCRSRSFSKWSLEEKGLRGFFAPSQVHGNPRFLHPRELGALLGVPESVVYQHDVRASNCLLGLIASPIQMVWIYASLRHNVATAQGLVGHPQPLEVLQAYKQEILRQLRSSFPASCSPPGYITLLAPDGGILHIVSPTSCTVGQLLSAQRISLSWGTIQHVCLPDGRRLQDSELLDGPGPYLLEEHGKKHAREAPQGIVAIGITHAGHSFFAFLEPGRFLFEALLQGGITQIHYLRDKGGRVYGADYRAWRSLDLTTIEHVYFPPVKCLRADGPVVHGHINMAGLSEHTIWRALCSIFPLDFNAYIIHPGDCHRLLQYGTHALPCGFHGLSMDFEFIMGIFPARNHWALVLGRPEDGSVHWTYMDGIPGHLTAEARELCSIISEAVKIPMGSFHQSTRYLQRNDTTCGTIALAHAWHYLGFEGHWTLQDLDLLHSHLSSWSTQHAGLRANGPPTAVVTNELASLLTSKGVPADLAKDRACQAIDRLGFHFIKNALQMKNAWATIKGEASKPQNMFRLVYPLELSQHQRLGTNNRMGPPTKDKKRKKPDARNGPPLKADPSTLELLPNVFVDDDGNSSPILDFDAVVAESVGVALCSPEQAAYYMHSHCSISTSALALAIAEYPEEEVAKTAGITKTYIPAKHKHTGEPLLLVGGLLQIGDGKVRRKPMTQITDLEVVHTTVLKVQVFRDSIDHWQSFIRAPVKTGQGHHWLFSWPSALQGRCMQQRGIGYLSFCSPCC